MTKIDFTAFNKICKEIREDMEGHLSFRDIDGDPIYASARQAIRGELADRRREWTIAAKPAPTLADYEGDLRIAARRAHTAAASPAQIQYLAALAFAAGAPVDGLLRSGALCTRQASFMISELKRG